jgi:hypothetical protein
MYKGWVQLGALYLEPWVQAAADGTAQALVDLAGTTHTFM